MPSRNEDRGVPSAASRWPVVIGWVGIVIGILMVVDNLDDLLLLPLLRSGELLRRYLGPEVADLIRWSVSTDRWIVAGSLIGMALGALLVVASVRLRRRRRSGLSLCRTWAWLAVAWGIVDLARASLWLARYGRDIPGLADPGWQSSAALGLALAVLLLFTYPVFLLVWLSRRVVRQEASAWPD